MAEPVGAAALLVVPPVAPTQTELGEVDVDVRVRNDPETQHGEAAPDRRTTARAPRVVDGSPGHRQRTSIRFRLLIWCVAILTGVFIVNQLIVHQLLSIRLDRQVDGEMSREIDGWQSFVALEGSVDPVSRNEAARLLGDYLATRVPRDGVVLIGIVDGRIAAAQPASAAVRLAGSGPVTTWPGAGDGTGGTVERQGFDYRWASVDVGDGVGTFVVAADLTTERAETTNALQVVALVALLSCLGGAAVAWATIGRPLEPLRRTGATARRINERQLSARIPVTSDDELGELCETFNGMLDRLDAAFAARRDFIDDLGHELRTPLTIVRGHLDVFPEDPNEQRETLELCRDELDRMGRDVECLTLVAKSRQPAFLARRPIDLAELLDESTQRARLLHREHVITVDRIAEGSAWCDPDRIYQALENLIANACKYSPAGTRVTVSSVRSKGRIRFVVSDQGLGIDESDQVRIFERFARGNGPAARREGTGLGLAIVRAVAEAHGGAVGVDSRPAAGATFWFTVADAATPRDQSRAVEPWGLRNGVEVEPA